MPCQLEVVFAARCYASAALAVMWCLSVETNKHIFKCFSLSGSHVILVFPYQMAWQYSDWTPPPPNSGVECRWGRQKSRF